MNPQPDPPHDTVHSDRWVSEEIYNAHNELTT
jgi:hypothetical protein